jgi:hypothetical protein
MAQLESAGVTSVVLCTTAFTKAAEEQWQALGFSEYPVVAVGHPLGSMPLEQVLAEAEKAVEPVLERLARPGSPLPLGELG